MKPPYHPGGFSLIEVTLAMGIAAFCLLAIFGLLPAGLDSNRESHRHAAAANLATSVTADLQAMLPTAGSASTPSSPLYNISASGTTTLYLNEDGSINSNATGGDGGPLYRATIDITSPSALTPREASSASINITWAAGTNPSQQSPAGSYETVVGLDLN